MSESNPTDTADDERRDRAETSGDQAPPTGEVMEAEEGGTQEPIDGP